MDGHNNLTLSYWLGPDASTFLSLSVSSLLFFLSPSYSVPPKTRRQMLEGYVEDGVATFANSVDDSQGLTATQIPTQARLVYLCRLCPNFSDEIKDDNFRGGS